MLDRIQTYEIEALIENMWMKSKESWEQARLQAYLTAQVNSTKRIDMMEFMTFPWENVEKDKIEDSKEEREAVMKEMKEWENIMNNNDLNNGK